MKRPTFVLLATLAAACTAPADSRQAVELEIIPKGFNSSKADIHAVCKSAGDQLLKHMVDLKPTVIQVSRGRSGPIALFQRGPKGEFRVRLDTEKTYWAQYSYQFAHEICHVLCRYEDDYKGNLWFEETLAELASIYSLREMSKVWRKNAPYQNWRSFAPSLRDYTDNIERKRDDFLEITRIGLPAYYRQHASHLKTNATDRPKNGAMAIVLLTLFERDPTQWSAIQYLNPSPSPKGESFKSYLTKWRNAAPAAHKEFIQTIAQLYGIQLD